MKKEPDNLNQAYKYCFKCGNRLFEEAEICPKCGVRQQNTTAPVKTSNRNKLTAALFALLLGGIGAHKFYLGKAGDGVVYLLFCWTGIPFIAGIIEGLVLLSMSESEFDQKYNQLDQPKQPKQKKSSGILPIIFVAIVFAFIIIALLS